MNILLLFKIKSAACTHIKNVKLKNKTQKLLIRLD